MGSSSRTITDYDLVPIMKGIGELYKTLSLEAYKQVPSGMSTVMDVYGESIVQISGLYNDGFLTAMGYNPNELIQYNVVDEVKLLQWVRDNLDPNATGIGSYRLGSVTMQDMAFKYLQNNFPPFSPSNRVFTNTDGKTYMYHGVVSNGSMVDIISHLNPTDTIDEYVAGMWSGWSVSSYPIYYTEVNGQLYWRVAITRTYTTTPTPPEEPEEVTETEVINVALVYDYKQIPDENHTAAMLIQSTYNRHTVDKFYSVCDGDGWCRSYRGKSVATVVYIGNMQYSISYTEEYTAGYEARVECANYVDVGVARDAALLAEQIILVYQNNDISKIHYGTKSSFGPVYSTQNAEAYPIIPLKVNGSIVGSTTKQNITLGKIGLSGNDFKNSLNDGDLNSAFLVFGMPITDTSQAGIKFIFESLYSLVSTTTAGRKFRDTKETLRVSFSTLAISTRLNIETKQVVGSIGPVGTYTHKLLSTTNTSCDGDDYCTTTTIYHRRYRKQADSVYYQEITVWDAETNYTVAGYKFTANIRDSKCIIPVSRQVLFKLDFITTCSVIEKTMQFMVFMKKTVKLKWYQTGIFQIIMIIVAIVITYLSWGALAKVGAGLVGATMSAGQVLAVAGVAVGVAGVMGVKTGILGQVVGVISIIYGGYAGITATATSAQSVLIVANSLVQATSMANSLIIQRDVKRLIEEADKATANNKKAQEALQEQIKDLQNPLLMPYHDRLAEIDAYYEVASGNLQYNYDILYNYDLAFSKNMV